MRGLGRGAGVIEISNSSIEISSNNKRRSTAGVGRSNVSFNFNISDYVTVLAFKQNFIISVTRK